MKNDDRFDELSRALAGGTSKRRALKRFFATALGLGVLGSTSLAEAAEPSAASRAEIARTSADLLSRLPDADRLRQLTLPGAFLAAIEYDRQLLIAGTSAQTWNDSQLVDFQSQVAASVQLHEKLANEIVQQAQVAPAQQQECFTTCAMQFLARASQCGTGLGGLLCDVLNLVSLDLCVLGCILGGIGL